MVLPLLVVVIVSTQGGVPTVDVLGTVPGSQSIELSGDAGPVAARFEELSLRIRFDSRKAGAGKLRIVHEVRSDVWWWMYEGGAPASTGDASREFARSHACYASDGAITCFTLRGGSLWVRESRERYDTRQLAIDRIVATIEMQRTRLERGTWQLFSEVPVAQALARRSSVPTSAFGFRLAIASVRRTASGWEVHLSGTDDRKTVVVLNADYELVDVR